MTLFNLFEKCGPILHSAFHNIFFTFPYLFHDVWISQYFDGGFHGLILVCRYGYPPGIVLSLNNGLIHNYTVYSFVFINRSVQNAAVMLMYFLCNAHTKPNLHAREINVAAMDIVKPQKNTDMICGFAYSSQGNYILFISL